MLLQVPDPPVQDMQIDHFQLVSDVEHLDKQAVKITTRARVPEDHTIFSGHFPGRPLMPGVLLSELMAQSSGFLLLSLADFKKMPFLAALKEVKLREFVLPGTDLTCQAERIHDGSGYAVMKSRILRSVDKKRVCDGTLTFRIVPFANEELHQHMLARAREVGLASNTSGMEGAD